MMATDNDWVAKIGKPAADSIVEMVAALECDYERLEELRDQKEVHDVDDSDGISWEACCADDADELEELEETAGECKDREEAEQRIQEDALSVRVFGERIDGQWEADKFELLLATGGPAVRIMGELDKNGEPYRACLEVQDWWKPWTQYLDIEQDTLLSYCHCFYFGE